MNKKILDISDRARLVFKFLVEDYYKNISNNKIYEIELGSAFNLSSATKRQEIASVDGTPCGGSTPSDFGLQFYTSALLELGQINDKERKIIDESSSQDEYHHEQKKITEVLNFLSKQTSLVVNEEKITKITKIRFL